MSNIPIYRAKKIDSDEYIEGYYFKEIDEEASRDEQSFTWYSVLRTSYGDHYKDIKIDPSTLAIHFHCMLDSDNKKIFASLSEDGKGGDIVNNFDIQGVVKYHKNRFHITSDGFNSSLNGDLKIVGIKE